MIEDRNGKNQTAEESAHHEIFSRAVRAGKRTYFFDVKASQKDDYFLTITESKKRFQKDGKFFYEKHKIFLYQEDFAEFANVFQEVVEFINSIGDSQERIVDIENNEPNGNYTNVEFDDLESVEIENGKQKN